MATDKHVGRSLEITRTITNNIRGSLCVYVDTKENIMEDIDISS